jgi:hypothetical protein
MTPAHFGEIFIEQKDICGIKYKERKQPLQIEFCPIIIEEQKRFKKTSTKKFWKTLLIAFLQHNDIISFCTHGAITMVIMDQ